MHCGRQQVLVEFPHRRCREVVELAGARGPRVGGAEQTTEPALFARFLHPRRVCPPRVGRVPFPASPPRSAPHRSRRSTHRPLAQSPARVRRAARQRQRRCAARDTAGSAPRAAAECQRDRHVHQRCTCLCVGVSLSGHFGATFRCPNERVDRASAADPSALLPPPGLTRCPTPDCLPAPMRSP